MRKSIIAFAVLIFLGGALFAKNNSLVGVKIIPLPDDRVRIDFQFSDKIENQPANFVTQNPSRLIFDFIKTNNVLDKSLHFKNINIGNLISYEIIVVGDRLRSVFSLSASVPWTGHTEGKIYTIMLSGKSPRIFKPKKEIFITNQHVNARYDIKHIDFRGTGKQNGRIVIDVSSGSIPIEVTQTGKEVVAVFLNTRIPSQLMKRYDVRDFQSPAQLISASQDGKNTRLAIINQGDYGYFAYQINQQFIIDVYPLSAEEVKQARLKKKVYTGKLISLNFQNIQIRAVLRLLAEFTGLNIVVNQKVEGNITLRLNNTPWDQALDIILRTNSLDKRVTGNIMMVAPSSELLKQEKAELKSQIEVSNLSPLRSELLQLNYAKAADIATLLKDKNNSLLSKRGALSVDARTNTIWIQDTGAQIEEIRELIKKLDVPVKQVLIEARIVEVTKDFTRDLGISWGVSRPSPNSSGALSGSLRGANQIARADVVSLADRLNVDLHAAPAIGTAASVGLALATLGDGILLDLELSAMETEGRGEVIASPRLITMNQQPAVIESGEEIPYQEATSSGATAVAFKKAVLSLKVTPQITPDGKIMMELQINQDRPSGQTFNHVPSILTKEIQTTVFVDNGQTIVLGGIYKQDRNNSVRRVPFLGQLPLIGVLFRNSNTTNANEELLIFITPRIITNNLSVTAVEGQEKLAVTKKFRKPARAWKE